MSALMMAMFCVLFTGGFIGWHLKSWRDRKKARATS